MTHRAAFDDLFSSCLTSSRSVVLERLEVSMKAALIAEAFQSSGKDILILTGEGQEESRLFQNIDFFVHTSPIELPSWETLPSERVAPSSDIVGARQKAMQTIINRKSSCIVISSIQASAQRMLSKEALQKASLVVAKRDELPFDIFSEHIQHVGYERKPVAVGKGEFAIRGGIIDIFCVSEKRPVRIEFFGDEVESIRFYDPLTQRTQEAIDSIVITPGKELEPLEAAAEGSLTSIFDVLGPDTIVVLDDLEKIEDRYAGLKGATKSKIFMGIDAWLDALLKRQLLCFTYTSLEALSSVERRMTGSYESVRFSLFQRDIEACRLNHPFLTLSEYYEEKCLRQDLPQHEELIDCFLQVQNECDHTLVVQSMVELEWLKKKLEQHGGELLPKTTIKEGFLSCGYARSDTNDVMFATTELTGRATVRRDSSRMSSFITDYDAFELEPGDYVVHFHHGLGKYCGVEKKPDAQGREQEFFVVEYAEKSRLYVPLSQSHLISKYVGGQEEVPKLHVLGSSRWKKLREETERAIIGYAAELLRHQANRVVKGGFAYAQDSLTMQLFEAEFPYTETDDQLKAIDDIKKDMCSNKAMDRLVCGDVGYGKTEVAMRAAFKAVVDGKKQVAILAPTTVLAVQHYENFMERMSPFGVKVGVLSRFSTPKQNKQTVEQVKNGEIDIIIGTHRLIQKDVYFKELGLVIIDEEQRFGVKAKELLKIMKEGVECLTLSATPIPRTLYLSLIGARDLSTISTPPHERLPIKTVVCEPTDEMIQTAFLRELNRGGQAFYIHNRVETIFEAADRVKKIIPKARVLVAHGQMEADELDLVFHSFKKGDVDILVATSIIENGIDIPNANTIIVDRADQFGIADLYQLRGRVGRWNRRAYAYFLLPARRVLSEVARKRIEAIAQAGGYGGGLKVAMRDLEIRGAGDILGLEQSGQVAAIGFHLYCKLLKRTIDAMQGKAPAAMVDTKIEIPFDAKLPEFYVNEISLRMEFYQRLGEAVCVADIDSIASDLQDRFGQLPEAAAWLIAMTRVRVSAALKGFTTVRLDAHSLYLERKRPDGLQTNRVLLPRIKSPEEFQKKALEILQTMEKETSPAATL
jgi:transcription-repair coupling factor (superfamily II helicase)